jgi:hypothetical protein
MNPEKRPTPKGRASTKRPGRRHDEIPVQILGASARPLKMPKTLVEINQIAETRQVEALRDLSCSELRVLLSALNWIKVPLSEERDFVEFYLKVVGMVQNCRNGKRRTQGLD